MGVFNKQIRVVREPGSPALAVLEPAITLEFCMWLQRPEVFDALIEELRTENG